MGEGTTVYFVHAGEVLVARAVLRFFKCCIDDVLVYRETDRRHGISSALYSLPGRRLPLLTTPTLPRRKHKNSNTSAYHIEPTSLVAA